MGRRRVSYLNLEHRVRRLRKRVGELEWWVARRTLPLDRWTINGKRARARAAMAESRGNIRFRPSARSRFPSDWPVEHTRLRLDLGGEGLLAVKGADGVGDEVRSRSVSHELSASRPPLLDRRRLRCASAVRCAEPRGASGARGDRVDRDRSRGFHSARHAGDRARADSRRLRGRSGSARGLSPLPPASRPFAPA